MPPKFLRPLALALLLTAMLATPAAPEEDLPVLSGQDAHKIIEAVVNHMRDKTSISTVDMTIHRPDWERVMTIKAWTKGRTDSIFRITAPARDKDNGTLKKGREMWTYNPKVNRVIKIPPSMMSQAWMGSDFSNNDLSKSDSIIDDYDHSLENTETHQNKKVYVIKSIPKPDAPVVWGMQILKIREDFVLLHQEFFDEELQPVKLMTTDQIQVMDGKTFPKLWKMRKSDTPDEYTLLEYKEINFGPEIPNQTFSLRSLKTPTK